MKKTIIGTSAGVAGLFFWAVAAVLIAATTAIPTFQILTIAFAMSFIATAISLTINKRWSVVLKQPWSLWLLGILGIFGTNVFYISAYKFAPASHAELINFLYPILIILLAGLLPNERFTVKHLLAGSLGFYGIFYLITDGMGLSGFQWQYWPGYTLAFCDAMSWAVFSLAMRHHQHSPPEMVGIFCGIGALLSLVMHVVVEATVVPTFNETLLLILMGLTGQGAAYYCWDFGVKRGDLKLLSVFSYFGPVMSLALMILFGYAQFSLTLLVACSLVVAGGLEIGRAHV